MKFSDTSIIIKELYPIIEAQLSKPVIDRKFRANIADFINSRHDQLYDIAPYTNIYFNQSDVNKLFISIGLTEADVLEVIKKCFFWNEDYRPKCAKEPYVEVLMCCIRYYLKHNETAYAELTTIYLLFSGKFYASLYSNMWKFPVNPSIMDFVINNMLSDKYDLKKEGTVFKAFKKLANSYITKYKPQLIKDISDDQIGKLIQQLRDREKSFLRNIFVEYLKAAENKSYLNYESDNLDPDEFRITDNDAARAARVTEAAMGILTSHAVSIDYCNMSANNKVKSIQIKSILETIILADKQNLPKVRRVINIMICDFMSGAPGASLNSDKFISYAITAKPNTKNPLVLEMKETIIGWLNQDAVYRKRSSTQDTANKYYQSILFYFALIIARASTKS